MLVRHVRLLLATVWVGSLWTIGYIVAPILFAVVENKILAGTIAGKLFQAEAWLSLACGLLLVYLCNLTAYKFSIKERRLVLLLIAGMLTCTVAGYFVLNPYMVDLRELMHGAVGPDLIVVKSKFGLLHGLSSVIYLLESLLAVALILKIR